MGTYGGNMDYNAMDEGAIVYLPVYEPGAYLMLGDGHAGHGDRDCSPRHRDLHGCGVHGGIDEEA